MKKGSVCLPCYGGWRWTVIGSLLIPVEVLFFHSCRQPLSDWSVWLHVLSSLSEIFDKLSVISAKLSVHVTGVDEAEKDWRLFDIWDRRFDKLPVIFAKLSLRVMGADASGKARCFSDFWACLFDFWIGLFEFWACLFDFLNLPLRILSLPLRSLKSRRVLIFIEDVQSTLEFLPVETPFLHFYDLDLSNLFFL